MNMLQYLHQSGVTEDAERFVNEHCFKNTYHLTSFRFCDTLLGIFPEAYVTLLSLFSIHTVT